MSGTGCRSPLDGRRRARYVGCVATWIALSLAIVILYALFKIGQVILKILLGLIFVALVIYLAARLAASEPAHREVGGERLTADMRG